jgi:hypothetical protein
MLTKTRFRKILSILIMLATMGGSLSLLTLPQQTQAASQQTPPPETPIPTRCPIPTSVAPPYVVPVTSPTSERTQVVLVGFGQPFDWVAISGPGGVFTGTERINGYIPVTVTLKPGSNPLMVLAHVEAKTIDGCQYGDYTVSSTVSIQRDLVCPALPIEDLRVQPVASLSASYRQVVRAQMTSADAVTVSVTGLTRTVAFTGYRELGDWLLPINLRTVGISAAVSSTYILTVTAHVPAIGDPDCGFGERVVSKSVDINGDPLVIMLGPAVCPAIAAQPVRVNPVITTTRMFTQVITGEKSSVTDRVLVRSSAGVFTATAPTNSTWHATIALLPARMNALTVEGIDSADMLCEQVSQTQVDVAGRPLLIQQNADQVWLPITGR